MDLLLLGSSVLAVAITAAFASIGFNRPSWSRSYTTAARYRFALGGLVAAYALLMWVVYVILRRVSGLDGDPMPAVEAVWAALLITTCVRALPWVSAPMRRSLHRLAGIPDTAHRVACMLASAEFKGDPELRQKARSTLLTLVIDIDKTWLPPVRPVHRLIYTSTLLFLRLRSWREDAKFAAFLAEARNDFDRLYQRFDRLSLRVSRTLSTIEKLGELKHLASHPGSSASPQGGTPQFDDLLRRLVRDMVSDICEDITVFHRDTCLLAARGVMVTKDTYKGREAEFKNQGFVLPEREPVSHYGIVLLRSALLLYFGCWIFFLVLPIPDGSIERPALILLITLNVTVALAMGVIPKIHWGFANSGLHKRTPVGFVIGAGVCAVAFAVLSNLAMGSYVYGGWPGALSRLADGSIYLPSTFATAATTAWLVQDHRWDRIQSAQGRRICDAVAFGSVWVVMSFIARALMSAPWVTTNLLKLEDPVPLLQPLTLAYMLGAFVFGGALGALLAGAVRQEAPRRRLAEPVELTPELAKEVPSTAEMHEAADGLERQSA